MRNLLLLCTLLCLFSGSLSAQKLAGIVYDRENQEPVPGAHVYIEGSSLYDVTKADGRFEIKVNTFVILPLVISHIAYTTVTIPNPFTSLPDTIFVEETENILGEVTVLAGRYSRNQLLRAFRQEFLGTSPSARSCIIENEDMIDVWFNSRTHMLKAICDEPIRIDNRYLGYKLHVTLDKFEVEYPGRQLGVGNPLLIDFEGTTFFKDMVSTNKEVTKRRESVFVGSASHFLRALVNEKTDSLDYWFLIKGDKWIKKPSECFTINELNGMKQVFVGSLLKPKDFATYHGMIYYGTVQVQRAQKEETEVIFFNDNFLIDAWGTPTKDILFSGYMGSLRFGDKLPADYRIDTSAVPNEFFVMNPDLTVEDRLQQFEEYFPTEKIYIHQDRTRFVAGETVWFKAYRDYGGDYENGSSMLYVDLIDNKNQTVVSGQWRIESDMVFGNIELPDTLPSGNYQLTAYTRWMLNPGMENYFTREIQVFSPQPPTTTAENQSVLSPSIELHFFPEGGQLVEGLPSLVAFKVTDQFGKGSDATGMLTDLEGNEVQRFQTQHNGMGVFMFEPAPGKQYIARLDNHAAEITLPVALERGITIEMKHENDWLHLTLRHTLNIALNPSAFYLTIHQRGEDYYTTQLDMTKPESILHIPVSYVPEGIFTMTVYDENLKAYCERLAFVNYPDPLQLDITTDRETYGRRNKVTVQIKVSDRYSFPKTGNFSMAVIGSGLDETENRNNFYSDYFLQSEIRGMIENPASYFDQKDSESLEKLDLLLLTHGWRKYTWDDMMSMQKPEIVYPVEKGFSLTGKVEMGKLREEQVNVTALLRMDDGSEVISVHPEANGKFAFTGFEFYDMVEVLLSATDNKQKILNMTVDKPVLPAPANYFPLTETVYYQDSLIVQVFGTMPVISGDMENTIYELPEVQVTARRIRGNRNQLHDSEFNVTVHELVDDFSYFAPGVSGAMAILEYIPQMRKLQRGGRTFYQVITSDAAGNMESTTARGANVEPYYILDGVRVDRKMIESTPASNIARVELVYGPSAMVYGSGAFAGAVIFHSKDWSEINRKRPVKSMMVQLAGYRQEKEFYSPDYSIPQNSYRPDYRKTLYWQPDVVLDEYGEAEFSFFTSDDRGEYIIQCEGKSDDGMIGVSSHIFKVQ